MPLQRPQHWALTAQDGWRCVTALRPLVSEQGQECGVGSPRHHRCNSSTGLLHQRAALRDPRRKDSDLIVGGAPGEAKTGPFHAIQEFLDISTAGSAEEQKSLPSTDRPSAPSSASLKRTTPSNRRHLALPL